jgi:hypothetical protein
VVTAVPVVMPMVTSLYLNQHLNELVNEIHRKLRGQYNGVIRNKGLEREIKQLQLIKDHEIVQWISLLISCMRPQFLKDKPH